MDHHCPWTGNCVGKKNHKFFMLFLIYGEICTLQMTLVTFKEWVIDFLGESSFENWQVVSMTSSVLALAVTISLAILLAYQLIFISKNITTIESFTEILKHSSPFNKSTLYENFSEVFGIEFIYWPIPIAPVIRNEFYEIEAI